MPTNSIIVLGVRFQSQISTPIKTAPTSAAPITIVLFFNMGHYPSPTVSCGSTAGIWSVLGDLDQLGFHLRNPRARSHLTASPQ